jgi:hypothetical protein
MGQGEQFSVGFSLGMQQFPLRFCDLIHEDRPDVPLQGHKFQLT